MSAKDALAGAVVHPQDVLALSEERCDGKAGELLHGRRSRGRHAVQHVAAGVLTAGAQPVRRSGPKDRSF
jgi:hypothetical protein